MRFPNKAVVWSEKRDCALKGNIATKGDRPLQTTPQATFETIIVLKYEINHDHHVQLKDCGHVQT